MTVPKVKHLRASVVRGLEGGGGGDYHDQSGPHSLTDHEAILAALALHDAEGDGMAMAQHMRNVHRSTTLKFPVSAELVSFDPRCRRPGDRALGCDGGARRWL